MSKPAILVTTTDALPGFRIRECRGVVRGIVVRSPTLLQGFLGGLKTMIGGRIGAYTAMCEQTRQQAFDAMVAHAQQQGANAVVAMRYAGSSVEAGANGASEVLCYGTAVVVEPEVAPSP